MFLIDLTSFLFPLKREVFAPSPVGEGWKGGKLIIKITFSE
jgi:hypothetical protein